MTELTEALADVRKAYRLIWAYQRRMMDLIQVIADDFEGLQFYAWSPLHTRRPTQLTSNPLKGKWAWDMVPFYKVSFLYKPEGASPHDLAEGDWLLEIHLDSDTAGFEAQRGEPDAGKFPDADTSRSTLSLIVWQCTEAIKANWANDVWKYGSWPAADGIAEQLADFTVQVIRVSTALEDLHDKAALRASIDDFKALIRSELGIEA